MSAQPSYRSIVTAHSLQPLTPLDDAAAQKDAGTKKNRTKVGSARPSSLLYTYGPGSVMDLPHFTVTLAVTTDHNTLEHLHTSAVTFDDLHVHLDGVAGAERRDVVAKACRINGIELLHDDSLSCRATGRARYLIESFARLPGLMHLARATSPPGRTR